jgi:hypothetical protein
VGAIFIADSVYHQPQAVRGFGNKLEIKENPSDHTQWFEREHHSTWYKFRSPATTTLSFSIIPDNIEDDIDFLVFEGAIPGICDKIADKQVQPIRSNISRNDKTNQSICGLRKDAPDDYVRSGVGSSFSRAIEVKQGDLFYLVIDYQDRRSRATRSSSTTIPRRPRPSRRRCDKEEAETGDQGLDGEDRQARGCNLTIDGMRFDEVVEAKGKSSYSIEMEMYRNLKIGCVRKGYMFTTVR